MTNNLGKSLHEIYKEDARKYKESINNKKITEEKMYEVMIFFISGDSLSKKMTESEISKLEYALISEKAFDIGRDGVKVKQILMINNINYIEVKENPE